MAVGSYRPSHRKYTKVIRVFLGNLGSGKSVNAVREMFMEKSGRVTYTNIFTTGVDNIVHITPDNIIKKVVDGKKVNLELNKEYWENQKKPLNILWDEIHLTANARMSMTKVNMVLSRFIAMARRITGFDKRGYGTFTFVAQKERTIDVNIRDLVNEIVYHISHWVIYCEDCGSSFLVNSEMQITNKCASCGSWKIIRRDLKIEVFKFKSWNDYFNWCEKMKGKWHFSRELIIDIEDYFKHYDTLQMTDLWENYLNE